MYIALKWLVSFSLVMWASLCGRDLLLRTSQTTQHTELSEPKNECSSSHTSNPKATHFYFGKDFAIDTMPVLHYIMFFAGATLVTVLRKKETFLVTPKNIFANIQHKWCSPTNTHFIKNALTMFGMIALVKYIMKLLWTKSKLFIWICFTRATKHGQQNDTLLHQKVTMVIDDRKKLHRRLHLAITENKNIRLQYQKEIMAKSRLEKHVEKTQKEIKEYRSKYVSFQNLYIVTHQENLFLKACTRKMSEEKAKTEENLVCLMKQVYQTKNTELKVFCANLLVNSSKCLLNSNAKEEIQKFLQPSLSLVSTSRDYRTNKNNTEYSSSVPQGYDAPKLIGLPGDYVWTVKDKDGMIDKVYEYQWESDCGETIRRIRQYSVYWDKDCLLDFSTSKSVLTGREINCSPEENNTGNRILSENRKFLTGSEAFQKFLQNNKSVFTASTSSTTKNYLQSVECG